MAHDRLLEVNDLTGKQLTNRILQKDFIDGQVITHVDVTTKELWLI